MQFRNRINAMFGKIKQGIISKWREVGSYRATFSSFGNNVYASDLVRSSIRALSEHTSKANVKCIRRVGNDVLPGDIQLQNLIAYRPNMYMNGKDFLYKIRTIYEATGMALIYIMRDDTGKCTGLYPMPKAHYSALDVNGYLYIEFMFANGNKTVVPWEDLAVLRKDYYESDIFAETNEPILNTLEMLNVTTQGLSNAIKSTSNLRGYLKSTKAMLDEKDLKTMRDNFVNNYMNPENDGGIGSLDATTEFKEVNLQPTIANYKHIEEFRNNIFRYYGVNDAILMSKAVGDELEAFYEAKIEPFLLALSLELTQKVYSVGQKKHGNEIMFESNRMQFMSIKDKLNLVQMVDRGALTPNEWRMVMNMAPIEGGDKPIRRLDTAAVGEKKEGGDDNAKIEE